MAKPTASKAQVLDLIDSVLRSWWTIVAGACFGLAAALLALHYMDPVYQATTKIFVAPQKIPEGYIRSTVDDDISVRLRTLREAVLSRPYMLKLITERFELPPEEADQERLIEGIRARVAVVSRKGRYFQIQYRDVDPERAAAVVNMLADHYIEENARFRASRAGETTATLEQLAADALAKLQTKEAEIAKFKSEHLYTTAEQLPINLQLLRGRQRALEANERNLEDARERLRLLETEAAVTAAAAATTARPRVLPPEPRVERLERLQNELAALRVRYSPRHPDVTAKEREIELVLAEAPAVARRPPGAGGDDAGGDGADSEFVTEEDVQQAAILREIARLEQDQARIREDIQRYERRVETTPRTQQQLDNLTKGYGILRDKYREYQGNVESAKGAQKMEEAQQGSRFEVIERAIPPVLPVSPKAPMVLGLGLIGGLLLFVGPVLIRRLLQPMVQSEAGLLTVSDVPMLAVVPAIATPESVRIARRHRVRNVGYSVLFSTVLAAAVAFVTLVEKAS